MDTSYNDIFSTKGLNSLTYNDPYAKLCFTSMIASQCQKKVIYIDLDTMFAAYAKSDLISLLGNTKCTILSTTFIICITKKLILTQVGDLVT
ncbi:MAG: hypothetical protein K0S67_2050 [Nitrososphaeraceae archaeon]|nr:hypothetical protein [Nitrososphaeraceae archaeon]